MMRVSVVAFEPPICVEGSLVKATEILIEISKRVLLRLLLFDEILFYYY